LGAYNLSATRNFAGLGTALLPSYSFTGDTNTGMWSPTADTLAWSTGGVERMRVLSNGNVGIGTVTPNSPLHVSADGQALYFGTGSNVDAFMSFAGRAFMGFDAVGADGFLTVQGGTGKSVHLLVNSNIFGSGTTGLFVQGSSPTGFLGNVGINTTDPRARFHILATNEQLRSGFNASNYWNATTGATGLTTFDAVGSGAGFKFSDNVELTQTVTVEAVVSDATATMVINGTTYKVLLKS